MDVVVHFTAQLRLRMGLPSVTLHLPPQATSRDAIACLAHQFASFREFALAPDGDLVPAVWMCVNEVQVPRGEVVSLQPSDRLYFVSAISGG